MNVPVGIREVAAHAGVSVATVSNVINHPEIVAQQTRDRVQAAITELGFVRPTAVFCANDLMALGVLQEMTRNHIRVPDDISIIGYDDIDFAAAAAVPLTSVRQPRQELGRTAARLLLEEAADDENHRHRQVIFEPELVVRGSTMPAR